MNIQFLFDFGSPNAFLSHRVLPTIAWRTGAKIEYVPVLLGGLFKLTGNRSPAEAFSHIKNKPAYEALEISRFITRNGIDDFQFNPHFPINTLQLMRGALAARVLGVFTPYVDRVFEDMWVRGLKMDDQAVFEASLADAGLPVADILDVAQTAEVKTELLALTDAAFRKGAFGSPTFLVGDELFFGKDRLEAVESEFTRVTAEALL